MVSKPRILYYDMLNFNPENIAYMRRYFDVSILPNPAEDQDDLLASVEAIFAPLGFYVNENKISRCCKLRVILSNTTSVSHIDTQIATARGIYISALHDDQVFLKKVTSTAEHTVGLILALHRNLLGAHSSVLQGQWNRFPWGVPRMLSRMQVGLVGYGRLGHLVAKTLRAMKVRVSYIDPQVTGGMDSLSELAVKSQILSIHAMPNPENYHLVDRSVLLNLPRGALVINTARGELLDTDALIDLLESGHLQGAALDVLEGEFDPKFPEIFLRSRILTYASTHKNLILTPHIGGSTEDAWYETQRRVLVKARRFLMSGKSVV